MRRQFLVCVIVGFCAAATSLSGQATGAARQKVIDALAAVAGGSCPERLMNPALLDACEQQLEKMQPALNQLGAIKEARYRGKEPLPNGADVEVYRVVFEN